MERERWGTKSFEFSIEILISGAAPPRRRQQALTIVLPETILNGYSHSSTLNHLQADFIHVASGQGLCLHYASMNRQGEAWKKGKGLPLREFYSCSLTNQAAAFLTKRSVPAAFHHCEKSLVNPPSTIARWPSRSNTATTGLPAESYTRGVSAP